MALVTRGAFLSVPILDLDEASYLAAAWEMLRGGTLYRDVADHHPPLGYAYYALAQAFGHGMAPVRLLAVLAVVPLTAYAASAFYGHDRRGLLAGLAYLVYGASYLAHDMHAVNCELLLLLPATVAAAALAREDGAPRTATALAAGLLLGVAVLVKYQAVLWLPAFAFALVRSTPSALSAAAPLGALGAGVAAPLLAAYGWFDARGAGPEFLYWNLTHNFAYAANPLPPAEIVDRAASALVPWLLVVSPLLWSGWRSLREATPRERPRVQVAAALALATVPAVFLGLRFYPHYFVQLYVPLALLAAPDLARRLERHTAGDRRLLAAPLALWVLATGVNAALYFGPRPVHEETRPVFRRVAERLRSDPCFEGGSLFVWGYAPIFYTETGLRLGSRFVFPESTLVGYVPGNRASTGEGAGTGHLVSAAHWDWLMDDLSRKRPTFVLDTAPSGLHRWNRYPLHAYPRLARFVREGYRRIDTVDRVDVYRSLDCPAD